MRSRKQVIYSASSVSHAHMLKQFLEEQGIAALVENESLQGAIGELPPGYSTSPCVAVPAEQAVRARQIALLFERQIRAGHGMAELGCALTSPSLPVWPTCPQCTKQRQTVCPVCHEAGHQLPLADFPIGEDGVVSSQEVIDGASPIPEASAGVSVVCPICDEAFVARFYRRCEWCGHDFGEGLEFPVTADQAMSVRERAVLMALVSALATLLIYFAWLFGS